jgi:hypothetical protein
MTLHEALKSGCDYKLPEHNHYTPSSYAGRWTVEEIARGDWQIKREPKAFECTWKQVGSMKVITPDQHGVNLKEFVGKKTRVTIEVLED